MDSQVCVIRITHARVLDLRWLLGDSGFGSSLPRHAPGRERHQSDCRSIDHRCARSRAGLANDFSVSFHQKSNACLNGFELSSWEG